jgi:hypothetical protein
MYAQLLEGGTTPDRSEDLELAIRDRLLPALREQEGFCGALHLVDRDNGRTMMIVCWETEEQAALPLGDPLVEELAPIASGVGVRTSVWEVTQRA